MNATDTKFLKRCFSTVEWRYLEKLGFFDVQNPTGYDEDEAVIRTAHNILVENRMDSPSSCWGKEFAVTQNDISNSPPSLGV